MEWHWAVITQCHFSVLFVQEAPFQFLTQATTQSKHFGLSIGVSKKVIMLITLL